MGKIISYHFRIDEDVLNNIKTYANIDGRQLNKEIEQILKAYAIEREFFDNDIANASNKKEKKKK